MNKVQFFYADEDGDERHTSFLVDEADADLGDEGLINLRESAQACSSAKLHSVQINRIVLVDTPPAAANGPYSAQDKLVILMVTVANTYVKAVLPAPLAAVLTSDDILDLEHAAVAAFLTEAQAVITDTFGNLVSGIVKGWRERYARK